MNKFWGTEPWFENNLHFFEILAKTAVGVGATFLAHPVHQSILFLLPIDFPCNL